jgi:hypothetical protein
LRRKKNLTEINHKVSVLAKGRMVFFAVFASKCVPPAQGAIGMPNVRQNAARAHPRSVGDRTAQALGAAQDPARLHDLHEPRDLGSLRELNQRFLELDWTHAAFSGRIAALTPAQRAAAANCPYALFDLRLGDCDYWQLRLEQVHAWHVADRDAIGAESGGVHAARAVLRVVCRECSRPRQNSC